MTKFGSRGSEGPQFAGPHYVATNSHGNIVISDFHNHNIKIFTKDGAFIFSFGTNGEKQQTLDLFFCAILCFNWRYMCVPPASIYNSLWAFCDFAQFLFEDEI